MSCTFAEAGKGVRKDEDADLQDRTKLTEGISQQ